MMTKEKEKAMYLNSYRAAFNKDKSFFFEIDASTIYAFLRDNYCGDSLYYRLKLLVTLLSTESDFSPKNMKKGLIKKTEELKEYLIRLQDITC
jgi:hypothetical protein